MIIKSVKELLILDKTPLYSCIAYSRKTYIILPEVSAEGILIFDSEFNKTHPKYWFILTNRFAGIKNKNQIKKYEYSWVLSNDSSFSVFEKIEIKTKLNPIYLF